jgi:RNA polymerase sigma factor (TIGR02999 family)
MTNAPSGKIQPPMGEVTRLLGRWRRGDAAALDELTPLVYAELHKLADHYMRRERGDHTLQPTALVNEAYLRLTGVRTPAFENRVHFYGAAATAMRRVLVDHAREHGAAKRGTKARVSIDEVEVGRIDTRLDLIGLHVALDKLAEIASSPARVVELRYFGGLSIEETAAFLGIAPATVKRHWAFARAWLHGELSPADR